MDNLSWRLFIWSIAEINLFPAGVNLARNPAECWWLTYGRGAHLPVRQASQPVSQVNLTSNDEES